MPNFVHTSDDLLMQYFNTHDVSHLIKKSRLFGNKEEEDVATKAFPAPEGFTFGCDPEAFVFKDDKPVPAAGLIPGSKAKPFKVEKGAIQVDGMAAEINIDPASSFDEFNGNISAVISQLQNMLPKGHELRWVPSVEFSEEEFSATPDENKELGCQPDFDAWSGGVNPPPCPENPFVRCAGGHLHLGWTKGEDASSLQHILNCQDLVKQLDFYLAAWGVTKDDDKIRPTLYGKMGACRYKDYGVEYRVLSNFWVPDRELRAQVWNRMVSAISQMNNIYFPDRVSGDIVQMLKDSINTHVVDSQINKVLHYPINTINTSYNRW